jgi:Uncharacterised nucleotidyltransferase
VVRFWSFVVRGDLLGVCQPGANKIHPRLRGSWFRRVRCLLTGRPQRAHSFCVRGSGTYEADLHESLDYALEEAGAYFVKAGRLRETVRRLVARLDAEEITYALVGGLALGEHGYIRMTEDIDVLVTPVGLERFRERLIGRGYVATHPNATRAFRDSESGVRIEILVTGEFPGDGKPKAVSFPDPAGAATEVEGVRVLTLPKIIELKLASGMTAPHRLRDLADVQEIIKARGLDADFASTLDPSVRATYLDLLRAVQSAGA